jgi:hypothetical protein
MYGIASSSLTDRFAWLFEGLCKVIGVDAHTRRMEAALAWAIWNRVRLLGERLIALAERVQAGRVARKRDTSDASPRLVRSAAQSPIKGKGGCSWTPTLTLPRKCGRGDFLWPVEHVRL